MRARIYLDTNVFISGFEATDTRSRGTWAIFEAIESEQISGVTSELMLAEVLTRPIATGRTDLIDMYSRLIGPDGSLIVKGISRDILIDAAELRATYPSLRLPDAIHLATAIEQDCAIVLSDNRRIMAPPGLHILRTGTTTLEDILRLLP